MGIMDKIRGEFIDIIEWTQPSDCKLLAYRFPRYQNEIKMGAQLTVREGQAAVFINEGQIADVFTPGQYQLETKNLPILSTLKGWKYGFSSPFKAEVYFVQMAQFTDNKWGTTNPIMKRDSDFGMVRLRAFGSYIFRIVDPAKFMKELVATDPEFEDYEIDGQFRQIIVARFADVLGKSQIPVLDLVGNYESLSKFALEAIRPEFLNWGIDIAKFFIENISLPAAVEEALDRRTSMGVVGNLDAYTQYQAAEAMREAANNQGSSELAGAGVGLGAGMMMANQFANSLGQQQQQQQATPPPPIPGQITFHLAINNQSIGPLDLNTLRSYHATGQLTPETLAWKPGMSNWQKASEIPELAQLFQSSPPPLPPK